MTENSAIEWTDHTFNPWVGCAHVSPGCENCYAEDNTFTRAQRARGRELWGVSAARHVVSEAKWREVKKWNAAAAASRRRTLVFCASMADVFEDRRDLDAPRARLWSLIELTPALTWQLLTKRPENAARLAPERWAKYGWPKNVWAMVSVEDQVRADVRIPQLLRIPARVRGISYEPALGEIDFTGWLYSCDGDCPQEPHPVDPILDWIIVGGESGPGARPFNIAWARSTVAQCKAAGVPVFVKQLGARPFWKETFSAHHESPGVRIHVENAVMDSTFTLRDRKGGDMAEWPEALRVREFPAA